MIARVAVLDDQPRMAEVLALVLRRDGHEVIAYTDPVAFLDALQDQVHDLLLTDLRMPVLDGVQVLQRARAIQPDLPVVLITAHGTVRTAVEAMHQGAVDFLQKPVDNDHCRAVVARALEHTRLAREHRYLRAQAPDAGPLGDVVIESAAMAAVFERVRRAARGTATVWIQGESGTGKELVARAVHLYSPRVAGPFEAVNCKALAPGVLETELFGHDQGAFTGAVRARAGLFERADGGTVFLDEIGDVDLEFQARLLRVLQERQVRRVGGDRERPVDVRIVVATHRDLQAEVAAGRFREDLYYRLAVIPIQLPPLRERPEAIGPLATRFLARLNRALGTDVVGWTPQVDRWLHAHSWPGNVRELENLIERGVTLCSGDHITLDDLAVDTVAPAATGSLQEVQDAAAARHIRDVLGRTGGARADAARILGVDRTTLYRLMRRLGID